MSTTQDSVPISSLAQWGYCPRRCGLIHAEMVFEENLFTLKGRDLHERADMPGASRSGRLRIERSLPLFCERLGIHGVADIVEFSADGAIMPVEYKLGGRPTPNQRRPEDLQLCAQAICLEEMFATSVPQGAIYHAKDARRRMVDIDANLRAAAEDALLAIRRILQTGVLPPPVDDERCPNCSLVDACSPSLWTAALRRGARGLFTPTESEGLE